ncbi:CLUMA_CG009435, isoform A [Clunio marinus]|uniref:CLUMA_CG009435, isoform A n=1 Tax=Clunio marinus TaxID=568069 RepID=A0A1J1I733_9DIPT|nr:CLUMA_CG009435, isoform A [Clunio marinus]
MGNCLKSTSNDDLTLLNGRTSETNRESIDHDQNLHFPENIQPIFYPSPGVSHQSAQQLTEDEQIKIAKRIGLIQHLPIHQYTDENFKSKKVPSECDICMNDFVVGDSIRYLPCMHQYHVHCVDNWLMRSLTCPSCCEPVDAGLLTSFETI